MTSLSSLGNAKGSYSASNYGTAMLLFVVISGHLGFLNDLTPSLGALALLSLLQLTLNKSFCTALRCCIVDIEPIDRLRSYRSLTL